MQICDNRTDAERLAQDNCVTAAAFAGSHQSFSLPNPQGPQVPALCADTTPGHQTRQLARQ